MAFVVAIAGAALLFIGATGSAARMAEPLSVQIDRLLSSAGLAISEISVSGHRYTSDTEIYAALALDTGPSIVRFDVDAARERIESLAWIETASVVRVIPNKLIVDVIERKPAAVWEHNGRTALIDRTGRVLSYLAGSNLPRLPRIAGLGAPAAASALLTEIETHRDLAPRIAIVHRIGNRRWTLELTTGQLIHLPAGRESEALLRLAQLGLSDRLVDRPLRVIDLRRDGVVALSSDTPTTAPNTARAVGSASAW